jgi:hypothetical protein
MLEQTIGSANELQEFWLRRAFDRARIDPGSWHPRRGLRENMRTVKAVYGYYGQLFLDRRCLLWAGMAAMIGPAFFAGFEDLGILPDDLRAAVIAMFGRTSGRLAGRAAGELGYYETTFLTMQKKIFEDQAPMHEAYLAGGMAEIEKFYTAGIIDTATLQAWRQIDIGRDAVSDSVADGNRMLLFREQYDIIDRYYTRMRERRWPLGPSLTYLMTLTGAPSVPQARPYPQQYPLRMQARIPRFVISARTPLADGNIAIFEDRWRLIETDTLPAYLALIRDQPKKASDIVSMPMWQRAKAYRLLRRAGQLMAGAVTHWEVGLRERSQPSTPDDRPAPASQQNPAKEIDLAKPLTREAAGFATAIDSRVWINRNRAPFHLTVTLPGGREYHAQADMAVMLSSTSAGDPDRLTVRLPRVGLEAATRLIGDYATQWGFSADEVEAWHASAVRRASGDRRYGTHVFKASDIGTMRVEFQVSHHVHERDFAVTALFSWNSQAESGERTPAISADRG